MKKIMMLIFMILILITANVYGEDDFEIDITELDDGLLEQVIKGEEGNLLLFKSRVNYLSDDNYEFVGYYEVDQGFYSDNMFVLSGEHYLLYSEDGLKWHEHLKKNLVIDEYKFESLLNMDGHINVLLSKENKYYLTSFLDYFNKKQRLSPLIIDGQESFELEIIDANKATLYDVVSKNKWDYVNGAWITSSHFYDFGSDYTNTITHNNKDKMLKISNGEKVSGLLFDDFYAIFEFDTSWNKASYSNLSWLAAEITEPYIVDDKLRLFTIIGEDKIETYNEVCQEVIKSKSIHFEDNYYLLWELDFDRTVYDEKMGVNIPYLYIISSQEKEVEYLRGFSQADSNIFNEQYIQKDNLLLAFVKDKFTVVDTNLGTTIDYEVNGEQLRMYTPKYFYESTNLYMWEGHSYNLPFSLHHIEKFNNKYYTAYLNDREVRLYESVDLRSWREFECYTVNLNDYQSKKTLELIATNGSNYTFEKNAEYFITSNDEELILTVSLVNDDAKKENVNSLIELSLILDKNLKLTATDALTDYKTYPKPNLEKGFYYIHKGELYTPKKGEYYHPCLFGYVLKSNDLSNYEATLQTRKHSYVNDESGIQDMLYVRKYDDTIKLIARNGLVLSTEDFKSFSRNRLDNVDIISEKVNGFYNTYESDNSLQFRFTDDLNDWSILSSVNTEILPSYSTYQGVYFNDYVLLLQTYNGLTKRLLPISDKNTYYMDRTNLHVDSLTMEKVDYLALDDFMSYDIDDKIILTSRYSFETIKDEFYLVDKNSTKKIKTSKVIKANSKIYVEANMLLNILDYKMNSFENVNILVKNK